MPITASTALLQRAVGSPGRIYSSYRKKVGLLERRHGGPGNWGKRVVGRFRKRSVRDRELKEHEQFVKPLEAIRGEKGPKQ